LIILIDSSPEEQVKAKPAAPVQAPKKPPVSKKWEGEDEDDDGPAVSSMGLNGISSNIAKSTTERLGGIFRRRRRRRKACTCSST